MESRNPFRVRTSEYLEADSEFLSLFGSSALAIFNPDNMWITVQTIRSARGGGKTSIMRIFSPKSLNMIYTNKTSGKYGPLFDKLKTLGAFSEDGIKVLGVTLSLFGDYQILNQLDFSKIKQDRLFFSLLVSRIIIATLRATCELKEIEFPNDLNKIYIKHSDKQNIPSIAPTPCNGNDLYQWASSIEQNVSSLIEGNLDEGKGIGAHEALSLLHIIRSKNIFYKNKPVAERTLLMLDDVDKLAPKQRTDLSIALMEARIPMGIWLAERLEALSQKELFAPEGTPEREYANPIMLEKFWRDRNPKFEQLLMEISDKRARWNRSYQIVSFSELLVNDLKDSYTEQFQDAIHEESERLGKKYDTRQRYHKWLNMCKNSNKANQEAASDWRLLEIAIERDIRKKQKPLFEDEMLNTTDFDSRTESGDYHVAECYTRIKYKIPYYYGFQKLVKLASSNIQQFLYLSSDLFDEMIVAKRGFNTTRILPGRQEEILRHAATQRWDEITQSVPNSSRVVTFLDTIAKFCYSETNLPNSPYTSVTGLAISSKDLKRLQDPNVLKNDSRYKLLAEVLSTCFVNNLIEALPESKQGPRGTIHLVMYLNRLLCFKYQLPLQYGGWREHSLDTLAAFVEGTAPKRRKHVDSNQRITTLWDV